MTITRICDDELSQDVTAALRAAEIGPVVIIDRGEPTYVLLRHDAYLQLIDKAPILGDELDAS
jgi:hypothetical protein